MESDFGEVVCPGCAAEFDGWALYEHNAGREDGQSRCPACSEVFDDEEFTYE